MSRIWLPAGSPLTRSLRGFGAPGKQPKGEIVLNRSHPLAYKVEGFALPSQAISNGFTRVNSGYQGVIRNTGLGGGVGPSTPELKPVSHLVNCATVVFWTGTPRSYTWGSVLYAERPTSQQIYKLRFGNSSTTTVTQTWRGATGYLLDGGATASIDTDITLHAAAYVTTADSHWIYADSNSGENIVDPSGTFNKANGQLLADPQDAGAYNNDIEIQICLTFNQPISREEFDLLRRDPWQIFEPADQSPLTIGTAAAGGVTGTGALADGASTVAGTGAVGRVGTGGLSAQASVIAGAGTVAGAVTGTGALSAQTSSIAGIGEVEHTGTGALGAQASAVAGTGTVTGAGSVTGTGTIDSASSAISGAGVVGRTGAGAIDVQVSGVSGAGVIGRSGTGAIQCGVATINGVGIVAGAITGTGALAAQAAVIAGTGTVYTPVAITGTGALVCGASSISGSETPAIWTEIPAVSTTWTEI